MQNLIMIGDYDATSIITLIFGALISSVLAFVFSYTREKRFLRLKIQIETAEAIMKITNEHYNCDNSSLLFFNEAFTNLHNSFIEKSTEITDIYKYIIKRNIESINNDFAKFRECFKMYYGSVHNITRYIESHQIVLNKFINFHSNILGKMSELIKLFDEISKTQFKVTDAVRAKKSIGEAEIIILRKKHEKMMEIVMDIDSYINDLQVGIQNEFYKKVFISKKIPNRKPLDPNCKVLTPEKGKNIIY